MNKSKRKASDQAETTPLLGQETAPERTKDHGFTTLLLYLTAFLVSLSFGVTQVPLLYVFRLMTCDGYYSDHPEQEPRPGTVADRCALPVIEASTARAASLIAATTTFFGLINLFITGWTIKKLGVKWALIIQVFWPTVRLLIQNVGVFVGGYDGINIIQASQIITIVGGPNGYVLSLNSFVTEIVSPRDRTASLGRLQGSMFFGIATGYLAGGLIADRYDIAMPFKVTLALFAISTLYVCLFLPPGATSTVAAPVTVQRQGWQRMFGPFKMFLPTKWKSPSGKVKREYGPLLLGYGAFMGVLATGILPMILQMYATDVFQWGTRRDSILVSSHSFIRGIFLTMLFPYIISGGRRWLSQRHQPVDQAEPPLADPGVAGHADDAVVQDNLAPTISARAEAEQTLLKPRNAMVDSDKEQYHFDLWFTKFSLIADGLLTALAVFIFRGWQLYLLAAVLPFASGTGSAAKGTMIQMCSADERVDALSAITLLENVARLSTTMIFGLVFAALTEAGRPELVFVCIGGVSVLGFIGILFCHFPEEGSIRVNDHHEDTTDDS